MTKVPYQISVAVAALWLPGVGNASRRTASNVVVLLRRCGSIPRAVDRLRRVGHPDEAAMLCDDRRMTLAEEWVERGCVLTVVDPGYPPRWREMRGAPPALWRFGEAESGPFVAVVGSRRVDDGRLTFCREVAEQTVASGFGVVSGAAEGCDRAALDAAGEVGGRTVAILPRGLQAGDERLARLLLSARPPGEPFSTAAAMERNALIYAAANLAVIGHARFREGGSWHGALDALRRKLCPLAVAPPEDEPGLRALANLGAAVLRRPEELAAVVAAQDGLFPGG